MGNIIENQIDVEVLKKAYNTNPIAKFIFDIFSARKNNSKETKMDRLLRLIHQKGHSFSRSEVIAFFRQLENIGCGKYIEGRKGHSSRFEWYTNLTSVGQAAAGSLSRVEAFSTENIDGIEEEDSEADFISSDKHLKAHVYRASGEENYESNFLSSNFVSHEYRLRPNLSIKLSLPLDLTASEATRLAEFIKTLPFE